MRVDDDQQAPPRMIKRHQRIGQHVERFGQAGSSDVPPHPIRLKEADHIVAEITHQSADKTRQTRQRHRRKARQFFLQDVQWILALGRSAVVA